MRKCILFAVAMMPAAVAAQGFGDGAWRVAPQFMSYEIKTGSEKTTVAEFAMPLAYIQPISSRLTFDIATSFATVTTKVAGDESTLSGLTDTQLRFNYTFGGGFVLTAGINAPTGQYKVDTAKVAAAGMIGNDFLAFPVSSFGNGFAGTGGVAMARTMGSWNLGLGASFRKSAEFGAFKADAAELRFTPADEMRVRAGLDREAFGGRVAFGVIYSSFGEDRTDDGSATPTTYSTGDRLIGQAALEAPMGATQLYVGAWLLNRAEGEQVGGAAPGENIYNVTVALGFNAGSLFLEPSVETRLWQVDGEKAGSLTFFGVRTRFESGSLLFSPSVSYGVGSLDGAASADIAGLRAGLTVRFAR
jgi:hypothetical protein